MTVELGFESFLAAPEAVVWAAVSNMKGVNRELFPWVRMTVPAQARDKTLAEAPTGEPLFASYLLALGVLPFDRHVLRLDRVERGHFLERSWSVLQRRWEHERWVESAEGGCRVRDRLRVEPRLAPESLVRVIVGALFRWRHRKLRRMFRERGHAARLRDVERPSD